MKILFSCMGTSDPVRGYRDGPLLHILRFYRPEKVVVFLTEEASELDGRGNRLEAMRAHMRANWGAYSPEFSVLRTDVSDPSDMDSVGKLIESQVMVLLREAPDAQLLLNLSSGTPQMKQVLAMLCTDSRYPRTVGIQVKNPEKAAGTAERTNNSAYSVEDELECNEDEGADCRCRCSEPELLFHKRRQAIDQILVLIERRDYSAVYAMKNVLPDNMKALVGHLDARDRMQDAEARDRARNLKLPFPLYPKKVLRRTARDYDQVSEVYLILLNRLHRRQYEELVLRMNPLVVRLQLRLLGQSLNAAGLRLDDVILRPFSDRPRFVPELLCKALPQVYAAVEQAYGTPLRECDVSIEICSRILNQLPEAQGEVLDTLEACRRLNESCRNELAHQLTALTAEQLCAACGMDAQRLMKRLGETVAALYPECDKTLFTVYKRCGDYIKDMLI